MDKHEEQIRRAEEAHAILHSSMFSKAFDDTRAAILNAIASLDNLRDDRARDLHSMVKGLEKVRRVLEEHISTGKLAQKEIEGRAKLTDLFKRRA
jgi:hypothetical protein